MGSSMATLLAKCEQIDLMFAIYTGCIFFNSFAFGMAINIIGPTLVDLQYVYATSVSAMAYLTGFNSAGYMTGSLLPFSYRWFNRQLTMVVFATMMAVCFGLLPFCGGLVLLYIVVFSFGLGTGAWDSSISLWLCEMFPAKSSAFLQTSQFAYGSGMVLGPLLASQYVHGEEKNETRADGTNVTIHFSSEERQHSLTVPFVVPSVMLIITPVILLITYFYRPYRRPNELKVAAQTLQRQDHIESCESSRRVSIGSARSGSLVEVIKSVGDPEIKKVVPYRWFKILLVGACLGCYGSMETNFWSFFSSALEYLPVERSASEASLLSSVTGILYTLGRLAAAFISLYVSPDLILIVHFVALSVALALLYISTMQSIVWLVYLSSALIGWGFSALYPGIFSWTEHYLGLTDAVCVLFSFLSGSLSLVTPIILGDQLKDNPKMLFYLSGSFLFFSMASICLAKLFVYMTPSYEEKPSKSL